MVVRLIIRWVLLLAALYGGIALVARLLAGRALYHPEVASGRAPAGVRVLSDAAGRKVAVLHLPNPAARFTIWLFHGNAEDLGDLAPGLGDLRDAGFAVFAHDYPGYGLSTGAPSEESLYAASRTARKYLREQLGVPADRTLLYGRSIGGGPAVEMAREEPVAGLVLRSAFVSVYRVLTQRRVLPFDLFENERKLAAVSCPVLVMHGRNDEVIPFAHGEALLAAVPGVKQSLWIDGAGHNDFTEVAGPRYVQAWREFAERCARAHTAVPRK
jgi:pimeloyl-ACP methyl ester carboxylesterase